MENLAIKNIESKIEQLSNHLEKFKSLSKNAEKFMAACIDMNTIDDLIGLPRSADRSDMESWGINASEWRIAIKHALLYKLKSLLEDNLEE